MVIDEPAYARMLMAAGFTAAELVAVAELLEALANGVEEVVDWTPEKRSALSKVVSAHFEGH